MRINQTENPRPRVGLLVAFVVLSLVLTTLWFREGESGILHRLRVSTQVIVAPISAGGEYVTRPLRGFFAWAGDLGVSRSQLEELRSQNQSLRTRVAELEEARLENERLRELVKLTQPRDLESIAARVIGRPANAWEGVITIDRGTSDGLAVGMPVIGPQGLLGQIVEVAAGSARVRLITDQRSGVAAMIQRSRARGVVKGSIDGQLSFDFVSVDTSVSAGDTVITSGIGGVYPKGIVVGEVAEVGTSVGGLSQKIRVQPQGDLGALEEVLVLIVPVQAAVDEGGE